MSNTAPRLSAALLLPTDQRLNEHSDQGLQSVKERAEEDRLNAVPLLRSPNESDLDLGFALENLEARMTYGRITSRWLEMYQPKVRMGGPAGVVSASTWNTANRRRQDDQDSPRKLVAKLAKSVSPEL